MLRKFLEIAKENSAGSGTFSLLLFSQQAEAEQPYKYCYNARIHREQVLLLSVLRVKRNAKKKE